MKTLYFLLGCLVGLWWTSSQALIVTEIIEQRWERDITAFTLTGYYEGWSRGREFSDEHTGWLLLGCLAELHRYQHPKDKRYAH